MKKSRTVRPTAGVESQTTRRLPLVELLIDTEAELFDLAVRSGLQVLDAMLEEDRTAICGPRYAHQADRTASRAGTVASTVVLGGRKVSIRRPRVRSGRQEVPLPTFQTMAQTDPLRRRTVEQLLVGVSTRGYARSLEPLPADIPSRSVSKSAVSRRFVAKTASQLAAWQATPLDELDLAGLLLDGVHIGEHCVVVALGWRRRHKARPRALGRFDGERDRLSEPARQPPESWPAHRSEHPRDARWVEGAAGGGHGGVRSCRAGAALPNPQDPQHPRPSAGASAALGTGDPQARLSERGRQDRDAVAATPRPPSRPGASLRGGQCARRARGDGDRADAGPLAASPALAGHDQRRREPHQQDPPRQTQREALAGRPDDAALGRRRRPRSGQGVPAPEGTC